jgi:RHS repeat-associated protein
MTRYKKLFVCLFLMILASLSHAQRGGTTTFSAADGHGLDSVDLVTLVPSFNFPVVPKSGGLFLESPQGCYVFGPLSHAEWTCGVGGGGQIATLDSIPSEMIGMMAVFTNAGTTCKSSTITGLTGADRLTTYSLPLTQLEYPSGCGGLPSTATVTTNDGTGYTVVLTESLGGFTAVSSVASRSGSKAVTNVGGGTVTDPFGNTTLSQTSTAITDMLGAVTTIGSSPTSYSYTDTTGTTRDVTFTLGSSVAFVPLGSSSCVNVTPGNVTPTTAINYPDGTSIGIGWQSNGGGISGLINSITLRTGGTISYGYGSLQSTSCSASWGFSTLSRTTPDGTTSYTTSVTSGVRTTTVLDPGKNKTVYTFTGLLSPTFLTSVTKYQNTGTVASPAYTLMSTTSYCYNNSCTTAPQYPINQRDASEYVGSGSTYMSHRTETYDSFGNVTSSATYDPITGQTLTINTTYGSWNGSACVAIGSNISDHPCDIVKSDGAHTLSESRITYNSNGAITKKQDWTGSSWLVTNYTPNPNGTTASVTAPNGQVTTYGYAATGSGGCNGLLPTSSSTNLNAVALSTSQTWDCNGGVILTTADANGNGTVKHYDVMFRPSLFQDQTGYQTTFNYTATSANSSSGFTGVVHDHTTYVDGLGRPIISQTQQGPGSSNYDTASSTYGWNGTNFQTNASAACTQASDMACSTTVLTSLVNSAFGPISTTDANGGTSTYARNANDVSVTAGPAPSGEHTKTVQTEVDGFGRLKSTCALESSGGTACGQVMGGAGILTSHTYSFATGSSTETVTRGSQTHTTVTDAIGRAVSKTTPEAGTVTNTYDSVNYGMCNSTSHGDLVMVKFNSGGYVCKYYDGLHRLTDVGTASSLTAWSWNSRRFRYDAADSAHESNAPPTGYVGNNLSGRLVEAYTDNYASQVYTDEWFSYDKDGRVTDMWQKSVSSNGWYHTTVTYNADGVATALTGIPGGFNFTWGVDGESRPNSSKQGSTTIVNGVTYDGASRPLTVSLGSPGSGNSDTYTYDSSGQMKTYTFTSAGKSMIGTLTWNPIRSLASLAINDGFNSGGTQTCTYNYDDAARLTNNSCGSIFAQTYSYDQYDNLTQAGGLSWNPGYNSANNHMTGSSYDSDGHVLYDGLNTYTWDGYGKMYSVTAGTTAGTCTGSAFCVTYDAFGRAVEMYNRGEWLYSPIGKVAWMTGQNVNSVYVSQPGGGTSVNGNSTLYFLHPDWLGTKRLSTLVGTGAEYFDSAYAPYGQQYDSFGTLFPVNFTGDYQDIFSPGHLYDTPNRELSQNAGRWLSPDPAGASWNAYAYATDPNTKTDPLGLISEPASYSWYLGFNMSGGGAGCTMDGVDSPCNLVATTLAAGGAGICPGSNCRITSTGQIYQKQWIDPYTVTYGSGDCSQGENPCGGDIVMREFRGHYGDVLVGSVNDDAADSYPGLAAFYNSAACPTCGRILRSAAGTMNDWRTYAAWYGGSALIGGGTVVGLDILGGEAGTAITDPVIVNSDKVLAQTDPFHNFGELIGQEAMQSGEPAIQNGWYSQWNIQGSANGYEGTFQYGGTMSPLGNILYVTHTLFEPF